MISIPDSLLRALGWVLAHSLWQGAVAALVLLLLLPRLQTAKLRYWAAYLALGAVLSAAIGTFVWKYEPTVDISGGSSGIAVEPPASGLISVDEPLFETTLNETFSQWLESNHGMIVALWLVGFVFFLLRLGGGLWQVHRLRTRGLHALGAAWQEKLLALGQRIGAPLRVQLFETAWVHTPLTIGWLKPAILLPIGFVNQLTPAEVEAVLAHELAHIARRDWVFNLFQAFVESLFYYHPAVWWISKVIRNERENACDDTALAATGNPIAFARALVQVQEMAAPLPALALPMSGKRPRPLLERVRRILNQAPQQQHQVMEKITATLILLALLALLGLRANSVPSIKAAFAQITDIPTAFFGEQDNEDQIVGDSLPKPKGTRKISREDETGRVEAEYKEGKLKRLNIDGKEIPEAEFDQHEALIEELIRETTPPPPPPAPPAFWGGPEAPRWDGPEAPEAPEAPERPEWPERPEMPYLYRLDRLGAPIGTPMPPLPPFPTQGGVSIATDKDDQGNTIIKLDNHGKSTEVVVKNGEVWIDGKKVGKGESVDIPGLHLGEDGEHFFYQGTQGWGYGFGDGGFAWSNGEGEGRAFGISPEQRAKIEMEMEQVRAEHEKLMAEHQRNFERDQKRVEKDWEKNQKDWEKQQKKWQKEQEKWAREQKVWQENQQKWQANQQVWEAKSKAAQELIKKELLRDGIITDPNDFSLKLGAKQMIVNGKKQSEALRSKYVEILKGAFGKGFEGEDWNYNINYSDDKQ